MRPDPYKQKISKKYQKANEKNKAAVSEDKKQNAASKINPAEHSTSINSQSNAPKSGTSSKISPDFRDRRQTEDNHSYKYRRRPIRSNLWRYEEENEDEAEQDINDSLEESKELLSFIKNKLEENRTAKNFFVSDKDANGAFLSDEIQETDDVYDQLIEFSIDSVSSVIHEDVPIYEFIELPFSVDHFFSQNSRSGNESSSPTLFSKNIKEMGLESNKKTRVDLSTIVQTSKLKLTNLVPGLAKTNINVKKPQVLVGRPIVEAEIVPEIEQVATTKPKTKDKDETIEDLESWLEDVL